MELQTEFERHFPCRVEPLINTQLVLMHDQKPVPGTQIFVQFVYRVTHQYLRFKSSYGYIHYADFDHQEKKEANTHFDLRVFDHSNISHPLLSRELSLLGVDPSLHSSVVDQITLNCKTSGDWQFCNIGGGLTVLPLRVTIEKLQCRVIYEEEEEDLVISDYVIDYEDVIRMIPASESSVKELLKRVKIGNNGKDACTVCLEELSTTTDAGISYAMQMPCQHVFHRKCILRWLKESHYCPVCRFEMPTSENSEYNFLNVLLNIFI